MEDAIRTALGRWSTPELVAMLCELEVDDGWEPWSPDNWLLLSDALAGWDTSGTFATQTDGPYVGPKGIAIAGNAAEDMLCLVEEASGSLGATLLKWDQILGSFERVD